MARRWTGNKPLPEPMLTLFAEPHNRHRGKMSYNINSTKIERDGDFDRRERGSFKHPKLR